MLGVGLPLLVAGSELSIRDPSQPLWLDDKQSAPPARPIAKKVIKAETYTLNAVYISEEKTIALINQVEYEVGQKLGPYYIDSIVFERVVLKSGGKERLLDLYPEVEEGFKIK